MLFQLFCLHNISYGADMYIILVSHNVSGHSCPSSHMNLTDFQSKTDSNFEPTTSLEIRKYMKGLVL